MRSSGQCVQHLTGTASAAFEFRSNHQPYDCAGTDRFELVLNDTIDGRSSFPVPSVQADNVFGATNL